MIKNFFNKNNNKAEDLQHKADKGLFSQVKHNQNPRKPHQEPVFFSEGNLASQGDDFPPQFNDPSEQTRVMHTRAIDLATLDQHQGEFRDQLQAQDLKQALNQAEQDQSSDDDLIYAGPGEPLDPTLRKQQHLKQEATPETRPADEGPIYYAGADAPKLSTPEERARRRAELSKPKAEEEDHYDGPVYLIGPKKKPQPDKSEQDTGPIYYAGAYGPKMRDTLKPKLEEKLEKSEEARVEAMLERTSEELEGVTPAPLDMLEGYNDSLESDSNYAESEHLQQIEKIPFALQCKLYIRQFIAAFFTHTTLNVALPKISLKLGPCYPSSMPVPYFVLGLTLGLFPLLLKDYADTQLIATLAFVWFAALTGLTGYRGLVSMCAKLARRRPDTILQSVVVFLYMMSFVTLFEAVLLLFPPSFNLALGLGVVLMIAACAATSLNYGLRQDLMDFYGSLTLTGLLMTLAVTVLVSYLILTPLMATSLLGVALLFRVIVGQLLYLGHARASRSIVTGCGYLVLLLLFLDLLFFAPSLGFLSDLLI